MTICVELHNSGGMSHVEYPKNGTAPSVDIAVETIRELIIEGTIEAGDYGLINVIRHVDEVCECDDLYIDEENCQILATHNV